MQTKRLIFIVAALIVCPVKSLLLRDRISRGISNRFSSNFKTVHNPNRCNLQMSWEYPVIETITHSIQSVNDYLQSNEMLNYLAKATKTELTQVEDETISILSPLGNDLLIFLCATIGIVPLFQWLGASPVLGFLSAGLLMGPAGLRLFSDLHDMETLADFGVLFLLFEQGLELTISRIRSVSKYAFGLGTLQVIVSTIAFFVFPFIGGVQFLEFFMHSDPGVVDIKRIDEALVIGTALSLSSSAFVLKILQEKNQLSSKLGEASLGVLLLQDIAVVPLLVLLPIIESNAGDMTITDQLAVVGMTFVKALFGLGGILLIGGRIIRELFKIVAKTRSSETFVALCLLVAVGVGAITDSLGLSSTLGAFVAGTLLAESNYRTQIETDIKPFKGLLLGLFFLTTGASVDPFVIEQQLPTVLALLAGLITFKATILSALSLLFDLSKADSVRLGLLLSGGGEFAFVVLTLADKLHVIPDQLAKILVGVVVLSMALTPSLGTLGDKLADLVKEYERKKSLTELSPIAEEQSSGMHKTIVNPVVICGYEGAGEMVVKYLSNRYNAQRDDEVSSSYIAFDLDPAVVMDARRDGASIVYGDGSQPLVLSTIGVENPRAFVVTYADSEVKLKAVERLRTAYPDSPIFVRGESIEETCELREAGATCVLSTEGETGILLSRELMKELNVQKDEIIAITRAMRADEEERSNQRYESFKLEKFLTKRKVDGPFSFTSWTSSPIAISFSNQMSNILSSVTKVNEEVFSLEIDQVDRQTND